MAYVFRRGWSKAYRRIRPPVVVSGAIQITLNAAIGSFVAATRPASRSLSPVLYLQRISAMAAISPGSVCCNGIGGVAFSAG